MMDKLDTTEGFTSFPLSHSLPTSPVSPEDGTFSILPRYLLQKVRSTFAGGPAAPQREAAAPRSRQSSNGSNSGGIPNALADKDRLAQRRIAGSPVVSRRHPQLASIREGSASSSVVSRAPRLSTISTTKRAAMPVVSRPLLASTTQSGLSRSQSSALGTLPESPLDYSPPPAYSANMFSGGNPSDPYLATTGFPLDRDANEDARSGSSIGGSQLGVAQMFRKIRGDGLTRDYWMADEAAVECYECNTTFSTWRRKHHCRICGRIFCSNCASNIVPGAQFGHEGLVRVCNSCVAKLAHREREGQSRNANSSTRPSLPASGSVANLRISLPLESMSQAPQSHFSASVLRNDFSSYNLAANLSSDDISQFGGRGRRYSDASMMRPETPDLFEESVSPQPWRPALGSPLTLGDRSVISQDAGTALVTPAPFRKTTAEEDKALPSPQPPFESSRPSSPVGDIIAPTSSGTGLGIYNPSTPAASEAAHYQMTVGTNDDSYEDSVAGRHTNSSGRPETPSAMSAMGSSLYPPGPIRSRLTSRAAEQIFDFSDVDESKLSDAAYLGNLARSQSRNSSVYSDIIVIEAAVAHTRALLIQCLKHAGVARWEAWEKVLTPILWRIAHYPMPKVQEGDSMDVRQCIKIKRVPGGVPADSEYVAGAVFTQSLLNKSLPRYISNPRIMLFDYPFQFEHDDTKLARFDALRDSEKDSLRKLANSVIQHRPHVVLVGKGVSGLALEYLHKANIVVARNVKASVLKSVARCTQAGIFNTYQHFPEATRLGKCQAFRVETFVHTLIPGQRKTLMRFEGCNKELGATVILRGGDLETLGKVKKVMQFMSLAVYSLRLEKALLWDEQATITPPTDLLRLRELDEDDWEEEAESTVPTEGEASQRETAQLVAKALRPYVTTILSTSPTVVFPPPHALARLRDDNLKIKQLQSHHRQEATVTLFSEGQHVRQDSLAAPSIVSRGGEPEAALETSRALTRSLSDVSLLSVKPQVRNKAVRISAELAEASQIAEAETRRNEHLRIWESRLARHKDDLVPAAHQHITVLKSLVNSYGRICDGPRISRHHYYRPPTDLTLRQWIVKFCTQSPRCINKSCDEISTHHFTVYAHGPRKLEVQLGIGHYHKQYEGDNIEIVSKCRICEVETDPTILSEEAGNYSFSKYLEMSFYNDELFCRGACTHNIHQDHQRFIRYKTHQIALLMSRVEVSDVAFPPLQIRVDAWTQLRMKNDEYRLLQKSANAYWDSVTKRIQNFRDDVLPFEKKEAGMQSMHDMAQKAEQDRASFAEILDRAYEDTPVNKPSTMNAPRAKLQELAVAWDTLFHNFELQFVPTDAERARRATGTQLRRLFSDSSTSAPSSPDLRSAFSSMPSVPSSPSLNPMSPSLSDISALPPPLRMTSGFTNTISDSSGSTASGLSSMVGSPISESAALQLGMAGLGLSVPSLQLTEANMAQLQKEQAPSIATSSASSPSIIDHGEDVPSSAHNKAKASGDQDDGSDSDSTVCAMPPTRTLLNLPTFDTMKSESEDADAGLAMKPFKLRRAKPVPSIANLVQRFEHSGMNTAGQSPDGPALPSPADSTASGLTSRPSVRRLRSDYTEVRTQRARQASGDRASQVLSDGDVPPKSAPARTSRYPKSPFKSTRPKSPSGSTKQRPPNERLSSTDSVRSSSLLSVPAERPSLLSRGSTASSGRSTVLGQEGRKGSLDTQDPNESSTLTKSKAKSTLKATDRSQKIPTPRPSPMFAPKSSRKLPPSNINTLGNSRVSTMARHFNHLSREAERERHRQIVLARVHRARPVAVSRATADVFMTTKEALREDSEEESSSSGADDEMDGDAEEDDAIQAKPGRRDSESGAGMRNRVVSAATDDTYIYDEPAVPSLPPAVPLLEEDSRPLHLPDLQAEQSNAVDTGAGTDSSRSVPASPLLSADSSTMARFANLSESEMSSTGNSDRQTFILKTLSSLWNYRGAGFTPLEYPHGDTIHIGIESSIPVREDEPSSIIAYGLSAPAYHARLADFAAAKLSSGTANFMPDESRGHGMHRGSNWELVECPADVVTDAEEAPKAPLDPVVTVGWNVNAGAVKCNLRVFFAEQFDALRKNCGCGDQFIESLMRCAKWDAVGGKSGAAFLKTKDDRFIIKEISKPEMKALCDWAPKYFEYMSRAFFQELPTVLAKILGVYRLSFKNTEKGRAKKMDVMVMENIYYNKIISRQFDLKGSIRNRLVEETDDKNCVLLDENLINLGPNTPLYVREHTKKHLETALHNDSLFLAKGLIMDYSLIVGIDKSSQELVVGIVDFLRSYTWDKKIESFVKGNTYLGAGIQEPTVLNPRMYKNRFREAMSRYFVLVPDRWTTAEAFQASQSASISTAAQTSKGKAFQAVTEDQHEQYAGGTSRPHSPTQHKTLFAMITAS